MNDVQKVAFETLKNFVAVCEKMNLEFYLVNGSALGAKKYKGFIPWDDDIDVAMPRKDYEKFLQNAQDLLPEPYFVQNYRTDKDFPFLYSKIRNSETAFIESSVRNLDMNHGIYIDVFPLDGYSASAKFKKIKDICVKVLFWFSFCALEHKSSFKVNFRNSVLRLFGFHKRTDKALSLLEKLISDSSEAKFLCNYADRQRKGCILREWYGDGTPAEFEGIAVKIPEKFDDYLSYKYGDWHSDLPQNQQKSHHTAVVVDTEKSYREYTVNNKL